MGFRRSVAAAAVALGAIAAIGGATAAPRQSALVHPLLPWHPAVRDGQGRLLAWYRPDAGLGYDHVLRLGWRFIEQGVPKDRRTGQRVYLLYPVFDARTLQGKYWQHNPAFLYASFVDSLVAWFPYSGDRRAIATVRAMLDYQLAHGTGPPRSCGRACRSPPAAAVSAHTDAALPASRGAVSEASSRTRSGS